MPFNLILPPLYLSLIHDKRGVILFYNV
uniref:Uncharacterized protein n=1 Tax=Salix viminalis TaxID=40686 RepID=A0A6N2KJW7_SALVM